MTAHEVLVERLNELHVKAGRPSLKEIGRRAGKSHTTVSNILRGTLVPARWSTLRPIVVALHGNETDFRTLWAETMRERDSAGARKVIDLERVHRPPTQASEESVSILNELQAIRALLEKIVNRMPERDDGRGRG